MVPRDGDPPLARFRAAADRTVSAPGGGQQVRAALACRLGNAAPPQFLILDEPTNHLDPEAIKALEAGPCGYDGALLVVSHDEAFLVLSHDEAFLEALRITRRVCLGGPAG